MYGLIARSRKERNWATGYRGGNLFYFNRAARREFDASRHAATATTPYSQQPIRPHTHTTTATLQTINPINRKL